MNSVLTKQIRQNAPYATSTKGMVKYLGGRRWQWLHRAIYIIGPLGILHFWWIKAGKHDFSRPILFGSIVGLLLLYRVIGNMSPARIQKRQVTPVPN